MRIHARFGAPLLMAVLESCAHAPGPEAVADQYRRAWVEGDAEGLRALSTPQYRDRVEAHRLRTWLAGSSRPMPSVATATATVHRARVRFSDGMQLELVRQGQRWIVERGGPDPDEDSSALGALRRFLAAALADDLEAVRGFMPASARARFTADEALHAHLVLERARIREVQRHLQAGAPELRGTDRVAEVVYASGRAARLELEEGAWRVLDLE